MNKIVSKVHLEGLYVSLHLLWNLLAFVLCVCFLLLHIVQLMVESLGLFHWECSSLCFDKNEIVYTVHVSGIYTQSLPCPPVKQAISALTSETGPYVLIKSDLQYKLSPMIAPMRRMQSITTANRRKPRFPVPSDPLGEDLAGAAVVGTDVRRPTNKDEQD